MSCKEITSWRRSKEKKKEKEPPLLRERSNINKTGVGRRPGRTLSFVCFGRSSLLPSSILAVTVHSVLGKRQTLCYMQKLHVQQISRFFQLDQHCSVRNASFNTPYTKRHFHFSVRQISFILLNWSSTRHSAPQSSSLHALFHRKRKRRSQSVNSLCTRHFHSIAAVRVTLSLSWPPCRWKTFSLLSLFSPRFLLTESPLCLPTSSSPTFTFDVDSIRQLASVTHQVVSPFRWSLLF